MGVSFPSVEIGKYDFSCCESQREGKTDACIAMRALCVSNSPSGPDESDSPPPIYDASSVVQSLGAKHKNIEEAQLSSAASDFFASDTASGSRTPLQKMVDVRAAPCIDSYSVTTLNLSPRPLSINTDLSPKASTLSPQSHRDSNGQSLTESQADALRHQLEAGEVAGRAKNLRMQLEAERERRKEETGMPSPTRSPKNPRGSRSRAGSGSRSVAGRTLRMTFYIEPDECEITEDDLTKLVVLQADGTALVTGLIEPLAMTVQGNPGVVPGDTIAIPGGSLSNLRMIFMQGGRVTLLITTRPEFLDIHLLCEGDYWHYLGIQVAFDKRHADRLRIQAVHDHGLVPIWNQKNLTKNVRAGDWITHVNGVAGNAKEMAEAMRGASPGDTITICVKTRARALACRGSTSGSMTPISSRSGSTVDWG